MGLFALPVDHSPEEQLRAAKANLELYADHRRNEIDESQLYLINFAIGQIETALKEIENAE